METIDEVLRLYVEPVFSTKNPKVAIECIRILGPRYCVQMNDSAERYNIMLAGNSDVFDVVKRNDEKWLQAVFEGMHELIERGIVVCKTIEDVFLNMENSRG